MSYCPYCGKDHDSTVCPQDWDVKCPDNSTACPTCGRSFGSEEIPYYGYERKPHTCPVCNGYGQVPKMYPSKETTSSYTELQTCPACLGACVLWG